MDEEDDPWPEDQSMTDEEDDQWADDCSNTDSDEGLYEEDPEPEPPDTKMTPTPLTGPEKNLTQKKVMRVIHGRKRLKLKTV